MSGYLSAYFQGVISNYITGVNMPSAPAQIFLALSSTDPTDLGTGITEPAAPYARLPLTLSVGNSNNAEGTVTANTTGIAFTGITSNVNHIAVYDALTGGNMLWAGPLEVTRVVTGGDSVSFATGVIKMTLGGFMSAYLGELIVNWLRGTDALTAPSTVKLGLSTTPPNGDGTGITFPPITDGYAHKDVTFDAPTHTPDNGTVITSNIDVIYGPAHTNPWGTIAYCVLISGDDETQLLQGPTSHSVLVPVTDGVGIVSGAVSFTVT